MHTPRHTQTQFSLSSLLVLMTACAVLFAFLGAVGVSPRDTLIGFAVLGSFCALAAGAIELAYRVLGLR